MRYYALGYSDDTNEIGNTFPQSQEVVLDGPVDDPKYLERQERGVFLTDVIIPQPVLHTRAKLTDLISSANISLRRIISNRLKSIFEKYTESGDTQFLPTNLWKGDQPFTYWILNPITFQEELIDFSKSEVWLTHFGTRKSIVPVTTLEQYHTWAETLVTPDWPLISKVAFKADAEINFIQLRNVSGGIQYYVSDQVLTEIKSAGCTGINFTLVE